MQGQPYPGQEQFQLRGQANSHKQIARNQEPLSQLTSDFVFHGEILEAESEQKYYRPQFNQQISPKNRSAIDNYQSTSRGGRESRFVGLILDGYI